MKVQLQFILLSLIFVFSCSPSKPRNDIKDKKLIFLCDVEKIDTGKNRFVEASGKDISFNDTGTQSDDFSKSGKYSSKLFPGRPYGLTADIGDIKPDDVSNS